MLEYRIPIQSSRGCTREAIYGSEIPDRYRPPLVLRGLGYPFLTQERVLPVLQLQSAIADNRLSQAALKVDAGSVLKLTPLYSS